MCEVEMKMNAVERMKSYAEDIPQEAPYEVPEFELPSPWPNEAKIQFVNLELRYREDLPSIIENFNLTVESLEKVGIVGRTGIVKQSRLLFYRGYDVFPRLWEEFFGALFAEIN
jgi:ABC-type multidrug transport system fused ATPase/permease subunit